MEIVVVHTNQTIIVLVGRKRITSQHGLHQDRMQEAQLTSEAISKPGRGEFSRVGSLQRGEVGAAGRSL